MHENKRILICVSSVFEPHLICIRKQTKLTCVNPFESIRLRLSNILTVIVILINIDSNLRLNPTLLVAPLQ